ncbi:Trypsin [Caballeronia temeraria]|uniref:Trypsin n=1 Tax=Caballeronia temeraria TaxID=1777137 RepID=A0A157ZW74_9BURK|nr:trypsin-like serine protease [Caballeronia temeraria]SAK49794.1 Trypsin [Caballeronia temeraria]
MTTFSLKTPAFAAAMAFGMATTAFAQQAQVRGAVTELLVPEQAARAAPDSSFATATPMLLPTPGFTPPTASEALPQAPSIDFGAAGSSRGGAGSGAQSAVRVAPELKAGPSMPDAQTREFGTSGQPFNTARVAAQNNSTQSYYPFSPTGWLTYSTPSGGMRCSASLIKPGVVVTAAHCVALFGSSRLYSNFRFAPAYNNGVAPFGTWNVAGVWLMTSYYNGTDSCAQRGVVCQNDIAVLRIAPQNGVYPGARTGWYGYGWNGWGLNASKQTIISQLGYPQGLDYGVIMERNESQSYVASTFSNNTIIGTAMNQGSSGGPWLVNLGIGAVHNGMSFGSFPDRQMVVGVTSWGYNGNPAIKQAGASPFTSSNIVPLVNAACSGAGSAC